MLPKYRELGVANLVSQTSESPRAKPTRDRARGSVRLDMAGKRSDGDRPLGPEKTMTAVRDSIAAFLDANLRALTLDPTQERLLTGPS